MSAVKKQRVVSGMRSTGPLHLGHLHGVLKNWVELQNKYECFFFAADWHCLTTHYHDVPDLPKIVRGNLIEWLACGLNPELSTLFIQSQIIEHSELHLLLSMITPVSWLERVPTYKDQQQKLTQYDLSTYGFLGYPLLQTADVLIYKANFIPVGEDQVPHIEFSREVTRRFNYIYGKGESILPEPAVLLTKFPKVPGLDGQKMSKSYNNSINLREDLTIVANKIRTMLTDPARQRRTDPGTPEKCPVWGLHKIYSDEDTKNWVQDGCTGAKIGCIDCKQPVINAITKELTPIQEKIASLESNPEYINKVIKQGTEKAREVAKITLNEVRAAIGLNY